MTQQAKTGAKSKDTEANVAVEGEDSFWGEAGKVNFPFFKFEKVGDKVKGVYVGKFQSTSSKYGYEQENYILVKDDGAKVVVSGRNARKSDGVKVIYGMEKIPVGGVIGFLFENEKDTGKGNLAKLISIRYTGELNKEVSDKFNSMFTMSQVATAMASIEQPGEGSGVVSPDDIPFEG